jgi:methionyl-tRNA synthetase
VPNWREYREDAFDEWKRDINNLLTQYIQDLDTVKLRSGISTVLQISQQGNAFLQSNKLDNSLALTNLENALPLLGYR